MMYKTSLIWGMMEGRFRIVEEEGNIVIPDTLSVLKTLFPGFKCECLHEFLEAIMYFAIPALATQFPELADAPENTIIFDTECEVTEVLPTNGFEWRDSVEWEEKFNQICPIPNLDS